MKQSDITRAINSPTLLYEKKGHAVYWLGITEPPTFRTYTYLIKGGEEALPVDPGIRASFGQAHD